MSLIQICSNINEQMGRLTVNGVDMHQESWYVLNTFPLWIRQAPPRGGSLTIPGAQGKLPRTRRIDEQKSSLPMLIAGDYAIDHTPTPLATQWWQLLDNVRYLRDNVIDPGLAGTIPATLDMPDGSVWSADVQVTNVLLVDMVQNPAGLAPGGTEALIRKATLEITVPAGQFTDPGEGSGPPSLCKLSESDFITTTGSGGFTLHIPGAGVDISFDTSMGIFDVIGAFNGAGINANPGDPGQQVVIFGPGGAAFGVDFDPGPGSTPTWKGLAIGPITVVTSDPGVTPNVVQNSIGGDPCP